MKTLLRTRQIVEMYVQLFGGCTQKSLAGILQTSVATAHRKLNEVVEQADWLQKGSNGQAEPIGATEFTEDDAENVLRVLEMDHQARRLDRTVATVFPNVPYYNYSALTEAPIRPSTIHAMMNSFATKRALYVRYASRSRESEFLYTPHALIKVHGRYHMRGWHHYENAFRDVVLSRVLEAKLTSESGVYNQVEDVEWIREVELSFAINPDLTRDEQVSLGSEWDRKRDQDGWVIVRCKKAIAKYVDATMRRIRASNNRSDFI